MQILLEAIHEQLILRKLLYGALIFL